MKLKKNLKISLQTKMNIAITGDKGFIGRHLKKGLEKEGYHTFGFNRVRYNLLDSNSLKEFVTHKDAIIHLAAVNRGRDSSVISGSICWTYNLLLAMRKFKSKSKFIYMSSVQAETSSLYGLSKRLTEIMLEDFSRELNIPVVVLRATNVFGERCKPFYNSVVATFCYQAVRSQRLSVKNKDRKLRLIYVGDVVKSIIHEIKTERKKLFYLKTLKGPKGEITVGKLAETIEVFKKNAPISKKYASGGRLYRNLLNTFCWYAKHKK